MQIGRTLPLTAIAVASVAALGMVVFLSQDDRSAIEPVQPAIAGGLPDLIVTGMAIELETGGGCYTSTQLGLRVFIRNNGSGNAGPFVVEANGNQLTVSGGLAAATNSSVWFAGTYIWPGSNSATIDATNLVTESDETNNQLSQSPPIPTLPLPCTPTPIPTKQPDPGDTDGDGCSDQAENGTNPTTGGLRVYWFFWDFFDTPDGANVRDKQISGTDFFRLLARFGATHAPPLTKAEALAEALTLPPAAPAYHAAFDRSFADSKISGSPDGAITGIDFFAMLQQFGHNCA